VGVRTRREEEEDEEEGRAKETALGEQASKRECCERSGVV